MILNPTPGLGIGIAETNVTPTAREGTVVTASSSANTKGSYATLIATTANPANGIYICISGVSVTSTLSNMLIDIALGDAPSGGNEAIIIPDIGAGAAPSGADGAGAGKMFFFPVYVPAGVSVRARSQASTGSDVGNVAVYLVSNPFFGWVGGQVSAYGVTAASSRGTSVTRGSGAWGTWTSITTGTARAHRFWALAQDQLADATQADTVTIFEMGHGPDSANVTAFYTGRCGEDGSEVMFGAFPFLGYYPLPAGEEIWLRVAAAATEARGYIVYGVD